MILFYYLIFACRRWVRASDKDDIREWKARFLLLWMEIYGVLNLLWTFKALPKGVNPILAGIVVTLPLVWLNEKALANKKEWHRYLARFRHWSRPHRLLADVCVALLFIANLIMPFVLKSLETHRPWWE